MAAFVDGGCDLLTLVQGLRRGHLSYFPRCHIRNSFWSQPRGPFILTVSLCLAHNRSYGRAELLLILEEL